MSTRASRARRRPPTSTSRSAPAATSCCSGRSSTTSSRNELYFKEYVAAYTNAATLVHEDFRDTEDLDGLFSGYDEAKGSYRQDTWAYASAPTGVRRRVRQSGLRGRLLTGKHRWPGLGHEHGQTKSERAAGDQHGGAGPGLEHAEVLRDETLQDPRCVMQILKRHYSRYTPEMVADTLRHQRRRLPLPGPRGHREQRARAHDGLRLRRGLDPAHPRRAVHPHRRDHPAAARQHGPSGRRHHGPARAREHPGLDRHPDALQHPSRLPRHAHGRRARHLGRVHLRHRQQGAEGLLGQRRHLCREPAQGLVGQGRDGREQLGLRLPAEAERSRTAPTRRRWRCSTTRSRATSCSARTPLSGPPTGGCSASPCRTSSGSSCATSR